MRERSPDLIDPFPVGGSARFRRFMTTRWTLVNAAGTTSSPVCRQALEELCSRYWYPLYAYVRSCGNQPEQARDLTQEFVATLLAKGRLSQADRERGRFRTFLLHSLRNFLCDCRDREGRIKRGGEAVHCRLDWQWAEERWRREPFTEETPEKLFEKSWAAEVLREAGRRLEREYVERGRERVFLRLRGFLLGERIGVSYREVGRELEMSEDAVKTTVKRMRQRFRSLVREEIAETVERPWEVEAEMEYLRAVIRRG
jgi:RNA polymerase sigma factor (sigma-70 family)